MENEFTIAVLITCHNRRNKTISSLNALFSAVLPKGYRMEVFLVDDGSSDGTSEAVKKEFPKVNLIHGSGQLFWNRGMYLAWESAQKKKDYDYYLWLNDDTMLFKNALNLMLEHSLSMNNKRIIVGATCSEINKDVTYSGYDLPNKKLIPNGSWQDCDFFNGNIVLIPSFVSDRIGLLDNHFRHSLGDIDYGLRALKFGFVHSLSPFCLGNCEEHEAAPTWCNHSIPFYKRLINLYTPLGNNPIEYFVFDRRHYGLISAIIHFFSIHLRAISPYLWPSFNNNKKNLTFSRHYSK